MPLTLSDTRAVLAGLGLTPKRAFGQNFLVEGNIVRKSLELAGIASGDRVAEVGPGLGTLTGALLEAGAEVWAVERDAQLAQYLRSTWAVQFPQRLHLLEGDAMEHPTAQIPEEAPFKIVANLPYAISTPWMDAVLEGPLPERAVLMLQLEAALRYRAGHGSKTFGSISVFLQNAYDVEPGHRVSSSCFWPRPEVDSYLLNLVRRPQPYLFPPRVKRVVRACFQQRRKQLATLLRAVLPDHGEGWLARLRAEGLSATVRAEEVPVALWRTLTECVPESWREPLDSGGRVGRIAG